MTNYFETPFGTSIIDREKDEVNKSLQGWSSADLYILNHLSENAPEKDSNILILNDSYGALSIPLKLQFNVNFLSDSLCAKNNCRKNLKQNRFDGNEVKFLNPEEIPQCEISHIILKNPKSLNYLEYQLQYLAANFPAGIPVIASDMVKNIHTSTVSLFEHYLEGAKTSLAWKKARLIFGETKGPVEKKNSFPVKFKPANEDFELINYPNLFGFGRVDPGAAFFMSNFPRVLKNDVVIDLACGDGIFAVKAAQVWKDAKIICTDESYLAIKSAKETFETNGFKDRGEFFVKDSLEDMEELSADVILCNPPFHNINSVSTSTAIRMFRDSFNVLKKGGELFVIANSHLGYEKQMLKVFKKVNVVRTNKKFTILRAVK